MHEEKNTDNIAKEVDSDNNADLVNSFEELKEQNAFLKVKMEENFNLFLRAKAETENIKKRADKEMDNIVKYSNKNFFLDLLPLLDSLESCLNNDDKSNDREGIKIFYKMLNSMLEKYNVKKISAELYSDFDPLLHEAISMSEHAKFDNKISNVVQNGYVLYDQILRYSKVIIFKKI